MLHNIYVKIEKKVRDLVMLGQRSPDFEFMAISILVYDLVYIEYFFTSYSLLY